MGSWGHKPFEDDDAMDWIADFETEGLSAIVSAFEAIPSDPSEYVEVREASMAIAAGAVLAVSATNSLEDLPESVQAAMNTPLQFDETLRSSAVNALHRVLMDSELSELWRETEFFDAWHSQVQSIIDRLQ